MNLNIVSAILGKELAETLRDKRTLMAMIGLPLLLYPAIILIMTQAMGVQKAKMERTTSRVAVVGGAAATVRQWVEPLEQVDIIPTSNASGDLQGGRLDAIVTAPNDLGPLSAGASVDIRIQFDSTEPKSRQALTRLQDGLAERGRQLLHERLDRAGLKPEFTEPLKVEEFNVAPPEKRAGLMLGTLLPMLMIMMIGVGAFYPAVDLTAGEKERGTFETLLSTPVRKTEIVCAKFLAVICLALLTGLLNLISMAATLGFSLSQAAKAGEGAATFSLSAVQVSPIGAAMMLAVLIPLTVFIGAAMMSIAIFARDFKEANNYVAPFFLVITIPAALAALPGMELTRATAFIPITNVALLFRDLLTQKATVPLAFLVFLSMSVYAMLTLVAAVRIFQSEDVVLSQEKGIPLSLRRGQFQPRDAPTAGLSLMLFGACLLLFFYIGTYVQQREIFSGIFISQWGLLLLPTVALLWFVKVDLRSALSLRPYRWGALPAMALMWLGAAVLINLYAQWQSDYLPMPKTYEEMTGDLFRVTGGVGQAIVMALAIALSPAICEEVLFRGAILAGFRTVLSPWVAVIGAGVMFGVMHISFASIIPTAMLGVAMGYLVVRSGSIYPAMLFHLLNNAAGIVLNNPNVKAQVDRWAQEQPPNLVYALIPAGIVLLAAGVGVMEMSARAQRKGV